MGIRHFLLLVLLAGVSVSSVAAQTGIRWGGQIYSDYSYVVEAPGDAGGDNGFGYRRLYLTGDYTISERISGRARLEAADNVLNSAGRPSPFVKDLFVRWKDAIAVGHELYLGISPSPGWESSERFFGYRSLEATIMDRTKIASSRDFGIRATGPVTETVRYNFMVGNNNSVNPEADRFKRLYGQFEWKPTERLLATLGGDFAARAGGSAVTANAFVGYYLEVARVGVEAFISPIRVDSPASDVDRSGVSVFAAARVSSVLEALVRYDSYSQDMDGTAQNGWYLLTGLSWTPEKNVHLIPNLAWDQGLTADDPRVVARVTLHVEY